MRTSKARKQSGVISPSASIISTVLSDTRRQKQPTSPNELRTLDYAGQGEDSRHPCRTEAVFRVGRTLTSLQHFEISRAGTDALSASTLALNWHHPVTTESLCPIYTVGYKECAAKPAIVFDPSRAPRYDQKGAVYCQL